MPVTNETPAMRPPPRMTVAELMALLEGCDRRCEVRLAFAVDDGAWQAIPVALVSFAAAIVTTPLPPPRPGTVWIIAAKEKTAFAAEAWTPTSYRLP